MKNGKLIFGGALSILWFLYKNMGFTGIKTQLELNSKAIDVLTMANISEARFPVAKGTKKRVFCRRNSSESSFDLEL